MFKHAALALPVFISIQSALAFSTGQASIGDHGYRKVDEGSISHCGTNTGQQCLQFETPLTGINLISDGKTDIACTPSGVCVFPFDFKTQQTNVTVECLNLQGKSYNVKHTIYSHFGKTVTSDKGTKYASFVLFGDDISAKWENDQHWTTWSAVSLFSRK